MNRTQAEILEKIENVKSDDFFGTMTSDLIAYLDFDNAKPYLKPDVTPEKWESLKKTDPRAEMIEYMEFAWDKANNERGLSAGRSITHYYIWLWLDGNEELAEEIQEYEYYGKPQLVKICEYLGLDSKTWDDGRRVN